MAELEAWKAKRKPIKSALTRFKNAFAEHDKTSGVGSLPARLQTFETLYDKYDAIQTQIDMLVDDDETAARKELKEREEFEVGYFEILTKVRDYIDQHRALVTQVQPDIASASTSHRQTPVNVPISPSDESFNVKLATITLPNFDGSFKDWPPFRDTFESLIHDNPRLSRIQKFHYLNSALTGDAARIIRSLGVSDSNYELAWNSLTNRYEDSSSLIHYHTKSLFDLSSITKSSYVSLRQLIDDTNNHLLALKALDEQTDTWDTMIIHLLTTKLDQYSKRQWEKYLISIVGKPKFKDMITEFRKRRDFAFALIVYRLAIEISNVLSVLVENVRQSTIPYFIVKIVKSTRKIQIRTHSWTKQMIRNPKQHLSQILKRITTLC